MSGAWVMTRKTAQLLSGGQDQFLVFLAVSAAITLMTGILYLRNAGLFEAFFGKLNPLLVITGIALLGLALTVLLVSREWVLIRRAGDSRGPLIAAGLALLLSIVIIGIDTGGRFPADVNRPFPDSLLFYPIFGYVVEVLFHLLPVTIVLSVVTGLFKAQRPSIAWLAIVVIAAIEPILQTIWSSGDSYPSWLTIYVFLHVYAINIVQLLLLRRYDFVSMYLFRLTYYTIWHIVWGVARLELFF
jgi:hypothetical protein